MNLNQEQKRIDSDYYVEGYATTWERYVLWEDDNGPIYERFERSAFDDCDMSDVIMQYDHQGKVLARQSNHTLMVETDEHGLFICADLSKSRAAKDMYEEIRNELVTKMSWGFQTGSYYYDKDTRTIVHTKVKKIYDVSAVSIPANDTTDINARNFINGEIDKILEECRRRDRVAKSITLKIKLKEI